MPVAEIHSYLRGAGDAVPCRSARCPGMLLLPLILQGCRGRSPLPEREVSSLTLSSPGGPQARQKKYKRMSGQLLMDKRYTKATLTNLAPQGPLSDIIMYVYRLQDNHILNSSKSLIKGAEGRCHKMDKEIDKPEA